jgi:plastocyanin
VSPVSSGYFESVFFRTGLLAVLIGSATFVTPPVSHTVKLERNRFVPAVTIASPGDTIRFVNGEGGPHNVAFDADSIPRAMRPLIDAAMPTPKIAAMSSGMLILPDETYTIVVPTLGAGRYAFLCTPHWANMRGAIVVKP